MKLRPFSIVVTNPSPFSIMYSHSQSSRIHRCCYGNRPQWLFDRQVDLLLHILELNLFLSLFYPNVK